MTKNKDHQFHQASRRQFMGGAAGLAVLGISGVSAQTPPKTPVTLNVIDVGGALALVQKPLENYRATKPNFV